MAKGKLLRNGRCSGLFVLMLMTLTTKYIILFRRLILITGKKAFLAVRSSYAAKFQGSAISATLVYNGLYLNLK